MTGVSARTRWKWALWAAAAIAVVAVAAWTGLHDLAREALGVLGAPNWCSLDVDGGLSAGDFRIDYFRRDEPQDVQETIFDGKRCSSVPPRSGETVFHIAYRGERICIASYFKAVDFALETTGSSAATAAGESYAAHSSTIHPFRPAAMAGPASSSRLSDPSSSLHRLLIP